MENPYVPQTAPRRHRLQYIDGLRGLAALAVAVFHLLREPLDPIFPVAAAVARRGFLGVSVFFVISGFVITQSLEGAFITPAVVGRFLVRRMARLDPPYWASMVLTFLIVVAAAVVLPDHTFAVPTLGVVAAHVAYLQYILDMGSFQDVYWTLCLEIQFYLLVSFLIGLKQRVVAWLPEEMALAVVIGPTFVASLLFAAQLIPAPRGSCFGHWYAFAAGVAAQRFAAGRGGAPLVVAAAGGLLLTTLFTRSPEGLTVAVTALSIGAGHLLGRLDSWLSWRPIQFLGRISYSLYLIHWMVGGRAANLIGHWLPAGPFVRLGTAIVGLLLAIACADLFWRAIEKPSIELSRWLARRGERQSVSALGDRQRALPAGPAS